MKDNGWIFILLALVLIIGIMGGIIYGNIAKNANSNDKAQKDKNGRYLTINNMTEETINEVYVLVDEATEIEAMRLTNPDKNSFSIKIPKEYKEYDRFTVILIDNFNMKFAKEVSDVSKKGRTEVNISKEDYKEEDGDFWKKIDKIFNKIK